MCLSCYNVWHRKNLKGLYPKKVGTCPYCNKRYVAHNYRQGHCEAVECKREHYKEMDRAYRQDPLFLKKKALRESKRSGKIKRYNRGTLIQAVMHKEGWTEEDTALLFQLIKAKEPWGVICPSLGRSYRACRQRYYSIKKMKHE